MSRPAAKGWCPTAYAPMQSGDGLLVRVRPQLGRLGAAQALALCDAAETFGNGMIDVTSRANLQIRGVRQESLEGIWQHLIRAGLIDPDPGVEARRAILTTPLWQAGDLTQRLHGALMDSLADWPDLPAKIGVVLDTGPQSILQSASGDFRLERLGAHVLLRADGAASGCLVQEAEAPAALRDLMHWFIETGGAAQSRMRRHLAKTPLPARFQGTKAPEAARPLKPGAYGQDRLFGVAFGQLRAQALRDLMDQTRAKALRMTPWRILLAAAAYAAEVPGFITDADDPALHVHACPGAPACASALGETRGLARSLAATKAAGSVLHVSGCTKGCAHPKAAAVTLIAAKDGFDLVRDGAAWDTPERRGLTLGEIATRIRP